MTTVGYGDITPVTDVERRVCILCMFIGATMFGYIIGSIAASDDEGNVSHSLKPVYAFCDKHGLSNNVRMKLKRHMSFWVQQKSPFSEEQYLNELPIHLRIEVLMHVHAPALHRMAMFRQRHHYRDWFIAQVVHLLQPMVVM